MPIDRNPLRRAKAIEVPVPEKGSRTIPSGGVVANTGSLTSSSEKEARWEPVPPRAAGTCQVSRGGNSVPLSRGRATARWSK
jgi:hypothetical protein